MSIEPGHQFGWVFHPNKLKNKLKNKTVTLSLTNRIPRYNTAESTLNEMWCTQCNCTHVGPTRAPFAAKFHEYTGKHGGSTVV